MVNRDEYCALTSSAVLTMFLGFSWRPVFNVKLNMILFNNELLGVTISYFLEFLSQCPSNLSNNSLSQAITLHNWSHLARWGWWGAADAQQKYSGLFFTDWTQLLTLSCLTTVDLCFLTDPPVHDRFVPSYIFVKGPLTQVVELNNSSIP